MYIQVKCLTVMLLCAASVFCSSSKEGIEGAELRARPDVFPRTIPPDRCRIIGSIMSIDSSFRIGGPDDPCSRAPCLARVRVESVLGYGSAFNSPLAKDRVVVVLFKFTLSPTKDVLPSLEPSFPGLNPGSRFKADLVSLPRMEFRIGKERAVPDFQYVVYGYEVKK